MLRQTMLLIFLNYKKKVELTKLNIQKHIQKNLFYNKGSLHIQKPLLNIQDKSNEKDK